MKRKILLSSLLIIAIVVAGIFYGANKYLEKLAENYPAMSASEFPAGLPMDMVQKKLRQYGYDVCVEPDKTSTVFYCKKVGTPCKQTNIVRVDYDEVSERTIAIKSEVKNSCEY